MNQSRTRATDNTSLLLTASNPYTKMAAPGWPGSCNISIKVTLVELAIPSPPPKKKKIIIIIWTLESSSPRKKIHPPPPFKNFQKKKDLQSKGKAPQGGGCLINGRTGIRLRNIRTNLKSKRRDQYQSDNRETNYKLNLLSAKVFCRPLPPHRHHKIDCPPNLLVKKKKREIMFFRASQRLGTKRSLKCIPPEKSHHFKKIKLILR